MITLTATVAKPLSRSSASQRAPLRIGLFNTVGVWTPPS
jgi:hypothetical protein